jgi:hypothetical protein
MSSPYEGIGDLELRAAEGNGTPELLWGLISKFNPTLVALALS